MVYYFQIYLFSNGQTLYLNFPNYDLLIVAKLPRIASPNWIRRGQTIKHKFNGLPLKSIPESFCVLPEKSLKLSHSFSGAKHAKKRKRNVHLAKNKRKLSCSHSFCLKAFVDLFDSYESQLKCFLQRDFFPSYHTSSSFSYKSFQTRFFPCLASHITAFLCFTHLSVWVGWLSIVFPSVCY